MTEADVTERFDAFYGDRTLVIAHRGARDVAPETRWQPFRRRWRPDADGIELDVSALSVGEMRCAR